MNNNKLEIDKTEWMKILEVFMPSAEMREYLLNESISKHRLAELICGSPVSLFIKLEWVTRLALKEPFGDNYPNLFTSIRSDISDALFALEVDHSAGELLYLKESWWDDDFKDENSDYGVAPFQSYYGVQSYILKDIADCLKYSDNDEDFEVKLAAEDNCWYTLEKWTMGDGRFVRTYTYYMFDDKIIYFEKEDCNYDSDFNPDGYWNSQNLNLPVPFKNGDVVVIDCSPFKPATLGKIVSIGDNKDCCSLQALVRLEDGTWSLGAVKHGHLFCHNMCYISPLYRIRKYEGEIPEEYSRLKEEKGNE